MSPILQLHLRCARRVLLFPTPGLPAAACLLWLAGCGDITCPPPLGNVNGICVTPDPMGSFEPAPEPNTERCDGIDNDGDDDVDEDWPELGAVCGGRGGRGECVQGIYVCATDGSGVVCEGEVGPTDEVCDGKDNDCDGIEDNGPAEVCDGEDNDCDGLVDEGVLAVKGDVFPDHATVAAVEGGFVVARVAGSQLHVETYDTQGEPTGSSDSVASPTSNIAFLSSDASEQRVLVALGQHRFHVLEAYVDSELDPVILDTQALHDDWDQGIDFGIYYPPAHPRVSASPRRFVGHLDLITFALNPFGDDRSGLALAPTIADPITYAGVFDSVGPYVVWEQGDKLRGTWLSDSGKHIVEIDVAQGDTPGLARGSGGPAVAYLYGGRAQISELDAVTLQCEQGRLCGTPLESASLPEALDGPVALGFDEAKARWFVAAGTQLIAAVQSDEGAVVLQVVERDLLASAPVRIDVAASGGTAAFVQAAKNGQSTLSFLGCF